MKHLFKKDHLPTMLINLITILIVVIISVVSNVVAKPSLSQTSQSYTGGTLSYQGTLSNSLGNPVTGLYEMTFRLYTALSEPSFLWEETRSGVNAVPVSNGLFNLMLGSLVPIPASVWEQPELYLGVKIGNDTEMSPREKLAIVPGAAMSEVAQLALSVPDASITGTQIADGSISLNDLGEQPYYFNGAFATQTEWMADVIFNGNYARFCEAIGRTYSRAETLQAHYTEYPGHPRGGRGNGFFYLDWYYVGSQYDPGDTHVYGNGDPTDLYNVWKYKGGSGYANTLDLWTYERSAIIWCN